MKTRRWIAALLVVAAGAVVGLVAYPRFQAAGFLRDFQAVQVGSTPFAVVERLALKYPHNSLCVGPNCAFAFQNHWLKRFGMAPATEFGVLVRRANTPVDAAGSTVASIDMSMLVNGGSDKVEALASSQVFDRQQASSAEPSPETITFDANGRPSRTVVALSPRSRPEERGAARAFNLNCLIRVGGCKTSRDLLPSVWSGAVHLRMALR